MASGNNGLVQPFLNQKMIRKKLKSENKTEHTLVTLHTAVWECGWDLDARLGASNDVIDTRCQLFLRYFGLIFL